MKALALVLCLAVPCWAATPTRADAPLQVKAGSLVPFDGVLDTPEATVDTEQRLARSEAKVVSYEKAPPVPVAVVIAIVSGCVGLALGVGGTVAYIKLHPTQ